MHLPHRYPNGLLAHPILKYEGSSTLTRQTPLLIFGHPTINSWVLGPSSLWYRMTLNDYDRSIGSILGNLAWTAPMVTMGASADQCDVGWTLINSIDHFYMSYLMWVPMSQLAIWAEYSCPHRWHQRSQFSTPYRLRSYSFSIYNRSPYMRNNRLRFSKVVVWACRGLGRWTHKLDLR